VSLAEAMDEARAFLCIRDEVPRRERPAYKRPARPPCQAPKSAVLEWLTGRGIAPHTIEKFKVGEQIISGKAYAVFPYVRDGELVNAKYRDIAEKRGMRQEPGAEPCLFGWHLLDPKERRVAITEGEIDAMTLHQVGIPALSVNAGAGNHQWIESDWDRLERFSEIFICFDDDEAGRKGAAEVACRLGPERCKLVKFGAKDANQWLQEGADGEEFHHALSVSKPHDPQELASIADYMDGVKSLLHPEHDSAGLPTLALGEKKYPWFEFRPGEYTCWTGINGHGKSLMLSQVMLGLMQQDQQVMVFSGELTPERQGVRLVKQATGLDRPTTEQIDAVGRWVRGRMWIFNVVGTAKIDRLLEVFSYGAKRYGIRHFVIDSLMMTDVPEDGPGSLSAQKSAVQKITAFAKRSGVHIHLVAHPRKARDESQAPGKLDVSGSSRITDAADNVFSVWSARKEESEPQNNLPDGKLELQKQRNGDVQHRHLHLYFNPSALQFGPYSSRRPVTIFSLSEQSA
jgi:twinkle protein